MNLDALDQPLLGPGETWDASLWEVFGDKVTAHPVMPLPDEAFMRANPLSEVLAFLDDRERAINLMQADPWRHGYELPSWAILDALCGFPWADPSEAEIAAAADDETFVALRKKRDWCRAVRVALLRTEEPLRVLLLQGGNRAAKSEWAARTVVKLLMHRQGRRAWCFHQDADMSIEYQQPLLYKYFPAEYRTEKGLRSNPTYISFKPQTGFSGPAGPAFVLPNASRCSFRYYEQDPKKIQGGELDMVWCDELVPAAWVKELKARVATRGGWMLITFTAVEGYTAAVKMFLDNAVTTREAVAFVLPEDGGEPALELALAGDDATAWGEPEQSGQPPVPAGRRFKRVPRCATLPTEPGTGVFWLHCWDNPFGNPQELFRRHASEPADYQVMKFYGVATKAMNAQLNFQAAMAPAGHIVRRDVALASAKRGTLYQVVDPCPGRNWAMIWVAAESAPMGLRLTVYREWPSVDDYVPGEGSLGLWAEPGEKMDGERGPAQRPLRWGHDRYRQEVFRLEGRTKWEQPAEGRAGDEDFWFDEADRRENRAAVIAERARAGRRRPRSTDGEDIFMRIMDSRHGATPTQTRSGQTTLLEECADLGFEPDFEPASGRDIDDGTTLINQFLYFDREREVSTLNAPRLLVSEDCKNLIWAMQNWTGADGQKGACKDFIDLLRYLVLCDELDDWKAERRSA